MEKIKSNEQLKLQSNKTLDIKDYQLININNNQETKIICKRSVLRGKTVKEIDLRSSSYSLETLYRKKKRERIITINRKVRNYNNGKIKNCRKNRF